MQKSCYCKLNIGLENFREKKYRIGKLNWAILNRGRCDQDDFESGKMRQVSSQEILICFEETDGINRTQTNKYK